MKVCLDPGHYGHYNQGSNPAYYESVMVLKLGFYLRDELQKCGISVTMTRTNENDLGLTARGQKAQGHDLFISLHSNAGPESARGAETFYSVDLPNDRGYAADLCAAVSNTIGTSNRGAKTRESTNNPGEDYYTVIDAAQDIGCPHVFIIEHAFHSNPTDCALLMDDNNLKKIAIAEAKVICSHHGISYVSGSGSSTPVTPVPSNLYRVRKSWDDVKSQIGAFADLNNAINTAKANAGYNVYDSNGKQVYPEVTVPTPVEHMYRVRKTWEDASSQIGAYKVLDNAKVTCDANPGYTAYDENGTAVYTSTPKTEPPVVTPPTPEPDPEPVVVKHAVMGNAEITIEQAETYLHKTNPDAPYYAAIYKAEAEKEGVRWDLAFAQSILETGYFKFTGDVKPEQNNFAGIGTTGGGVVGASFETPQLGIRAQIQHLKAYASTEPLAQECVDPRFNLVTRGKAPYIEDFGNGVWAASTNNYGGRIYQIFESMKATVGEPIPEPKPDEPKPEPEPTNDSIELTPETVSAFKIVIQFIINFIKKILGK